MDKWIAIILDMEDCWHESAEYKRLPSTLSEEEYRRIRDVYKAEHIYHMYGFEYFYKFVKLSPHITDLLDEYVPCKRDEEHFQCTMFCHRYDFKKGCMLNATE